MRINVGYIEAVHDRFVDVRLINPTQIIKNVVKVHPLDLDEREERCNIKVGAEVMVLTDEFNISYALGTISQGIALIQKRIARLENPIVYIYGDDTTITGVDGKIGNTLDMHVSKIKIRNDENSLFPLLAQLAQAVADTTPIGGSSSGKPNAQKGVAEALKSKFESFS